MWLLIPLILFALIYVFICGIRFAFRSLKSKEFNKKIIGFVIGIVFSLFGIIPFWFGHDVHLAGLAWKFKANEVRLTETCNKILATQKPNEYFWDDAFDLWPALIGPARKAVAHVDGVVYISVEAGPGDDAGVCYNPTHKPIKGVAEHLFVLGIGFTHSF